MSSDVQHIHHQAQARPFERCVERLFAAIFSRGLGHLEGVRALEGQSDLAQRPESAWQPRDGRSPDDPVTPTVIIAYGTNYRRGEDQRDHCDLLVELRTPIAGQPGAIDRHDAAVQAARVLLSADNWPLLAAHLEGVAGIYGIADIELKVGEGAVALSSIDPERASLMHQASYEVVGSLLTGEE